MDTMPTKDEARELLKTHVSDTYQRFHAEMVARAVEGYAEKLGEDTHLWWLTGYLHDIDYEQHPQEHPGPSLLWFKSWGYPQALIDAVLAHAYGFNGFTTKAVAPLSKALVACDEICGIFYAYQKLNPIPFSEMKASSIKKKLLDERFAPGINRSHITTACEEFEVSIDDHINNLITFFTVFPNPNKE